MTGATRKSEGGIVLPSKQPAPSRGTLYSSTCLEKPSEKPRRRLERSLADPREGTSRPLSYPVWRPNPGPERCSNPFRTVSEEAFSEVRMQHPVQDCVRRGEACRQGPLRTPVRHNMCAACIKIRPAGCRMSSMLPLVLHLLCRRVSVYASSRIFATPSRPRRIVKGSPPVVAIGVCRHGVGRDNSVTPRTGPPGTPARGRGPP
jgi:hypothetical protein